MTKLEKIVYDAIVQYERDPSPGREDEARRAAAAVLPLIENAFDAGFGITSEKYNYELTHEYFEEMYLVDEDKAKWIAENITLKTNL